MNRMSECTGALLTGGRGKRFGGDKMPAALAGRPLASYGHDFLRLHFSHVIVCGRFSPDAESKLFEDRFGGGGPLAGIESALRVSPTPWVFILAGDMPFPQLAVLDRLWERVAAGGTLAVVPRWSRGVEPLFALYHSGCLSAVQELLDAGERSILRLHEAVPTTLVDLESDLDIAPFLTRCFLNVNSPEDLALLQE